MLERAVFELITVQHMQNQMQEISVELFPVESEKYKGDINVAKNLEDLVAFYKEFSLQELPKALSSSVGR